MDFPRIVEPQPPGVPVDVSQWKLSDEFGVYPVGSKPKRLLIAPDDIAEPFLIPGHRYLFKTALGWQSQQVWAEVIAYRIAKLVNLPVPPCFIAIDRQTGETGALVEFFLGYPGEEHPARLVHAADVIASLHRSQTRGRPHNLQNNVKICRLILGSAFGIGWWATAFGFDALIGNTDRHTENWGFLVRPGIDGKPQYSIAPLYDNGTSFGYERTLEGIAKLSVERSFDAYLARGSHLCGWDMRSDVETPHFELCAKLLAAHPDAGAQIENVIRFDMVQISDILADCSTYEVGILFEPERAAFVSKLLAARQERLRALLRG